MTSHLNLMFSIWIGYYPNQDDPMFPRTQASIGTGRAWRGPTGNSWVQMHSLVNQKFTIFEGNCKVNILDITQGSYGNCYLVAALAALASLRSCIIKDSFLTHEDNPEHIYVTRWFMHGRPRIVAVDDWIPAENGVPTGVPPNGRDTFWVQILEKAWSKMLGSYRNTSGGNQCDVFTALTGAPNEMYYHQNERDLKVMFNTICGWLKIGRPVGSVAHSGQLDNGHAYAIVGCYTVTLNGQTHDLIKHYNPYNQGSRYKNNPWGDNSPNLNAVKDQIPDFIGDDKDGYTYQNLSDFKNNFSFVIASWSMPGYTPLVFETPWNQEVRYGNWASYSWTLTVKAPQVGKRLFIYIHDGTARGIDEAAWQCKDLVATDKNGTQTKSFKVNSGRYPIDKYNQIIVESPIEGDYTITANVYQNKEFGSFPLAVYAVTNGVQFNEPFKKYELYDQRYQKPCSQTCTSGLCNFSRGQCA